MKHRKNDTLLMLSGGIDSVALAYNLKEKGLNFSGLYIDFGMEPRMQEMHSVKYFANELDFPLEIFDLSNFCKSFLGHIPPSQISIDELDVLTRWPNAKGGFVVPLAIASFYGEVVEATNIQVGVLKSQSESRKNLVQFFEEWPRTVHLLTGASSTINVGTPFIGMSKTDVLLSVAHNGIPFEITWSCLYGGREHCGVCKRCKERKTAFQDAKITDPTLYLNE